MNKIKIKNFFYSSSKIALAILIVIGIIYLIIGGYSNVKDYKKEQELKQLAQKKEWPNKSIKHLNVKLNLSTKWNNGRMSYIFRVNNYSNIMDNLKKNKNSTFLITFFDKDDFEIEEIKVPDTEMSGIVNDKGKRTALIANTSISMSKSDYEKLAKWTIGWNF